MTSRKQTKSKKSNDEIVRGLFFPRKNKTVPEFNEKGWPFLRFNSGGSAEYACPHGIGHGGLHGCDGCCRTKKVPMKTPTKQQKGLSYREWEMVCNKFSNYPGNRVLWRSQQREIENTVNEFLRNRSKGKK